MIGAAGYAGALCARIVWRHPELELVTVTGRSDVGRRVEQVHPRHRVPLEIVELDLDAVGERADAALVAYPHGAAAPVVGALLERGLKVVDLSADLRLDRERYERYYQEHGAPDLIEPAVYGLTERYRDQVARADVVANPGCYPTAALLALLPLADRIADVVIDAKSGVSGAGREPSPATHFVAVDENVWPYGLAGHRHRAELERFLPGEHPITFIPHLAPLDQGLLASCYVTTSEPIDERELNELFSQAYADEPFIRLVDAPPGVRDVRETNDCAIHTAIEPATGRVLVFAAIDNLWKGAAGQAVQNLNLMLGIDETLGLAQ